MKLPSPLTTPQSQRVETALGNLQSTHAAFEAKVRALTDASAALATADRQFEVARRDRYARQVHDQAAAQLAAVHERAGKAKDEMEAARRTVVGAIEAASRVVSTLCTPLLEQFRSGLATALQPFCTNPAAAVAAIADHHSELPALHRFLHTGHHVSRTVTAEEIERLVFELGATLRRIRDGGEVWRPVQAAYAPTA